MSRRKAFSEEQVQEFIETQTPSVLDSGSRRFVAAVESLGSTTQALIVLAEMHIQTGDEAGGSLLYEFVADSWARHEMQTLEEG